MFLKKMDQYSFIPVSKDPVNDGYFVTLKSVKEIKFGDKSTITNVKTPMADYQIPEEINDNLEACGEFRIYISDSLEKVKENVRG